MTNDRESTVQSDNIHPDISSVVFDETTLQDKCRELGATIARDYADLSPLLLVTVSGAFMFASDLCKFIQPCPPNLQIDFIRASSYGANTVSSGEVDVQDKAKISCEGRHVLIIEDIVDTGATLHKLIGHLNDKGAVTVKVAALLNKESRRKVQVPVDYEGFKCPDEFVVGCDSFEPWAYPFCYEHASGCNFDHYCTRCSYGMDYDELYRTLPYVGILKPDAVKDS